MSKQPMQLPIVYEDDNGRQIVGPFGPFLNDQPMMAWVEVENGGVLGVYMVNPATVVEGPLVRIVADE